MQVILEPTVTVVGRTQFVAHPKYEIPPDGDDATRLGSFAAKGCYDSFSATGRSNTDNQKVILESAHGSVLEHISYSLFIEGVTRALTLELNRHRHFAISQRSTRYTAEEDSAIVLDPYYALLFRKHDFYLNDSGFWTNRRRSTESIEHRELCLLGGHLNAAEEAIAEYKEEVTLLCELNPLNLSGTELRKWARGKARNILPHSLETRGTWTGNLRAWRWFLESRSNKYAESEIRRLADVVLQTLRNEASLYFADFEQVSNHNDIPEWKPTHSKV